MKDKKISIINNIFLIFTIIYTICDFIFFLDIYSDGWIFSITTRLYRIGFVIFVISNTQKIKTFTTLTIISAITIIIDYISIISFNITYSHEEQIFRDIWVIIFNCLQQVLLAILLIFNTKEKKKINIAYILFIVTIILSIVTLIQEVNIKHCLIVPISIYIAMYLLYFNKDITEKSFKNIILLIIIVILIIGVFIFLETLLPELKQDYVVKNMQKIDLVDSTDISTITKRIKYNNKRSIIYNVSNNVKEEMNNDELDSYLYDDMRIVVSAQKLDILNSLKSELKSVNVNGRIFYMLPYTVYKGDTTISMYTNISGDIFYNIIISFEKNVHISKDDLKNLKPFFCIKNK